MRSWTNPSKTTQHIAVLLFERFSNHCLANAIEPLRAANELLMYEAYTWQFVTIDGAAVKSSSGMPVLPDRSLDAHAGGDFLFVVSSYDVQKLSNAKAVHALRACRHRFAKIVGMDTGTWLLAQAGLLSNLKATIHRAEMEALSERFPEVDVVADRVVMDNDIMSCGGAMTAFDLVLEIIRRAHGEAIQLDLASFFLHQSTKQETPSILSLGKSKLIEACVSAMSERIENPALIASLASALNVSQKTLTRAFLKELGAPPQTVYQHIRLAAARRYVEHSSHSIAEIAVRCGYRNASSMTRAFATRFGMSPSDLRKAVLVSEDAM